MWMTSHGQCPRGGVLVNVQEGGVFQFFGGQMTSRGQCPRGGGCAWCSTHPSSDPPPTWLAGYGPAIYVQDMVYPGTDSHNPVLRIIKPILVVAYLMHQFNSIYSVHYSSKGQVRFNVPFSDAFTQNILSLSNDRICVDRPPNLHAKSN